MLDQPNVTHATMRYRTVRVQGLNIFYREAGDPQAPTVLLLHGFPSSSRMFDTLLPLMAGRYHLVAPDYPGFGHSDSPPATSFEYSFEQLEYIVDGFANALGLDRYFLYLQDYGGPIGLRHAIRRPERIRGLIVQNAVAHEEGLGPMWASRRAFWADRKTHEASVMSAFTSLEGARLRHVGTSPHPERYNPDTWTDEFAALSRPGQDRIQSDLFHDYQTNVASYGRWQAWLRQHRPPTLVLWGIHDTSFTPDGARAYGRDLPEAEIHLLDAGHFALDEATDEIAAHMRRFLAAHAFKPGASALPSTGP